MGEDGAGDAPGRAQPALATVTGLTLAGIGLVAGLARLHDNSFLTHLATGRLIRSDGIPRVDPYSFTAAGEPWVVQSWLPSWVYASLEALWGLDAVRVLTGLLCAAIAGILWRLAGEARSLLVRLAVVAVGMGTMVGFFAERPLLVGFIGVGLCVLACDGRLDPRWLVPFGWVWVSSHGSFPMGVVVIGVLLVGSLLDRAEHRRELHALGWLVGGIVLGAVNPLGPRLLWFPVELLGRSELLTEFVKEWMPPTFASGSERAFLVLVALGIASLVWRPRWRSAGAIVVFVFAALLSRRNIPLVAVVLVPIVARSVPPIGSIVGTERRSSNSVLLAVVVAAVAVVSFSVLRAPATALDAYPVDEVLRLDELGLLGPDTDTRLLAPEFVGNFLTARYGADASVFVDDRFDMYPMAVLEDYADLHRLRADPAPILDRHAIVLVLWPVGTPLDHWLAVSESWTRGPASDRWALYCRAGDMAEQACG